MVTWFTLTKLHAQQASTANPPLARSSPNKRNDGLVV
jgi:hypothetical protein